MGVVARIMHPGLRTRIALAFLVVVIIVGSLVFVGAMGIATGARAREMSEKAGNILSLATAGRSAFCALKSTADDLAPGREEKALERCSNAVAMLRRVAEGLEEGGVLRVRKYAASIADMHREVRESTRRWMEGRAEGDLREARGFLSTALRDVAERGIVVLGKVEGVARSLLQESVNLGRANAKRAKAGFAVCIGATFILGFVTMTVSYREISGNVRKIINAVLEIAKGETDLGASVFVPSKDIFGELADSINVVIDALKGASLSIRDAASDLIGSAEELAESVEHISASMEEISASVEQISAGAQEQAARAESISRAVEEIRKSIEEIHARAREYSSKCDAASRIAGESERKSADSVRMIEGIHDRVKGATALMDALSEKVSRIARVTDIIKGIAEQTNLLALNAAIEAARAGVQGSGFAVVASEVRKLAESSRESAVEISKMTSEIVRDTELLYDELAFSAGMVEEGVSVIRGAGESMGGVVSAALEAADAAREISGAIYVIARNVDSASGSISEIAAIAQQSVASVGEVNTSLTAQRENMEQVSRAAEKLSELGAKLNSIILGFKI